MGSDSYRNEMVRLQKEAASLHVDLGRQEEAAAKARAEAGRKRRSASQTRSTSSIQSYLAAAESEDRRAAAAEKKIGEIRGKLATIAERQRDKHRNLESALKSERTALDRVEDQKRRKENSDRAAADRADAARRQREKDHAREIARLSRPTVHHVHFRAPEPEKLRVLYLTSSPILNEPVRVDAEMNNVLRTIRGSKHRNLIDISPRPAATPQDLLDGINDLRPHVIHFSGHGSEAGLVFDDASLDEPGAQGLAFDALAKLLAATSAPPTLVVLNACCTLAGAEALLATVPVVIAMADTVGDTAAGLFAYHFYGAIGGAQSIGAAIAQAREMVALALPHEPDVVSVRTAAGIDPHLIFLVRPL